MRRWSSCQQRCSRGTTSTTLALILDTPGVNRENLRACCAQNDSLVFFQSSAARDEDEEVEQLPAALRLSRYEQQFDLPVHVYTSANM